MAEIYTTGYIRCPAAMRDEANAYLIALGAEHGIEGLVGNILSCPWWKKPGTALMYDDDGQVDMAASPPPDEYFAYGQFDAKIRQHLPEELFSTEPEPVPDIPLPGGA